MQKSFKCEHCNKDVSLFDAFGTHNRNHCPSCLWSKHVDLSISGDRKAQCHGLMEPVSLTFKHEGLDKYGKEKQGELMLVHHCQKCGRVSINRIAGDDDPNQILEVNKSALNLTPTILEKIANQNITALGPGDESEIKTQLFGK